MICSNSQLPSFAGHCCRGERSSVIHLVDLDHILPTKPCQVLEVVFRICPANAANRSHGLVKRFEEHSWTYDLVGCAPRAASKPVDSAASERVFTRRLV